ncbi:MULTISPECIES: hypothetical protein [unclassified Acinetobacter]|nr:MULTISPECIES: hypothetical protein [unclassified Acinetobacter]MDM1756366.1 hypothetical protein [Acinetobacter sp. 256-1]MDM1759505.1 hypothetical protein [Acinetobacter sp. 251-1]
MKCAPADLSFLFQLPYLTLARHQTALPFLLHHVQLADELSNILTAYPNLKYQPLDFYYILHKSLSIIDEDVITDLMSKYGWQGKIIAAFLCFLAPDPSYKNTINNAIQHTPKRNQWLLHLALSEFCSDNTTPYFSNEIYTCFKNFRKNLIPIRQARSIRKIPYENLETVEQQQKLLLKEIYNSKGKEAAHQFMRNSIFYNLFFSFK